MSRNIQLLVIVAAVLLGGQLASAKDTATNSGVDTERWRYVMYEGRWWYWMPGQYWVYWDGQHWSNAVAPATNFNPYRSSPSQNEQYYGNNLISPQLRPFDEPFNPVSTPGKWIGPQRPGAGWVGGFFSTGGGYGGRGSN